MIWRLVISAAVALSATPPAAVAQTATFVAPAGVQCLTRPYVDANGASQTLSIYVLSGEAATWTGRGFTPGACTGLSAADYRNEACRIAHLGNDAVQNRLTQVLGAAPADLCAAALRATPRAADSGS